MPVGTATENAAALAGILDHRHWSHEDEIGEDLSMTRREIETAVRVLWRRGIRIWARDGLYMLNPQTASAAKAFARTSDCLIRP